MSTGPPSVWLLGDSILDNSYWNSVENQNTGQVLASLFGQTASTYVVRDRSTEEATLFTFDQALAETKTPALITVGAHYVKHRREIAFPYDAAATTHTDGSVSVNVAPTFHQQDWVVLSLGGNDFVLRNQTDPEYFKTKLTAVLQHYLQRGITADHLVYVLPYRPSKHLQRLMDSKGLSQFYTVMTGLFTAIADQLGVRVLDLSDFTENVDFAGTHIPEPTATGARKIAERVHALVTANTDTDTNTNTKIEIEIKSSSLEEEAVSPLLSGSGGQQKKLVIVDCGSGYSRASLYALDPQVNHYPVQVTSGKSSFKALHTILAAEDATLTAQWCQTLIEVVSDLDADVKTVLLGATAGVREALASGTVTPAKIARFRAALASHVPPQYEITLEILSGDDEAKYEHTSAVYSAQLCGYHDENEHVKIGLLSSGGMSSQIHFDGLSVSIDTLIKKGNALGEEKGMDHAVDWFRGHIRAEVDRTLVDNFGQHHEHETLFLAIEMFAAVGEKAGMKGQVVPATDAVNRLEAYVDQLIDADKLLDSEAKRSWKTYVHVMSGIMSAYILSRLHNEANVLFLRQYQHEPSGATLKPSWCLGHAISSLGLA